MAWMGPKRDDYISRRRSRASEPVLMVKARVNEKQHARSQRIGVVLVVVAGLAAAAWAGARLFDAVVAHLFSSNSRYDITTIDLPKSDQLGAAFLREQVGVAEGANLFAVDLAKVRANLESVSKIRSAEVRRRLPGTLEIRVTERVPLARIQISAGGCFMADNEGVIFPYYRSLNELPVLMGLGAVRAEPGQRLRDTQIRDALKMLDVWRNSVFQTEIPIAVVDVGDPAQLLLTLAGGARIHMGRDQFDRRLTRLAEMVHHARELGEEIEEADLTVNQNESYKPRAEPRG